MQKSGSRMTIFHRKACSQELVVFNQYGPVKISKIHARRYEGSFWAPQNLDLIGKLEFSLYHDYDTKTQIDKLSIELI